MFKLIKRVFNRKERESLDMLRKYQTVYNTPEGRWVIEDILAICKYGESGLGGSEHETYFNLGQQNVGLEIAQRINANILKLDEDSRKEEVSTDVYDEQQ